MQVIYVQAPRSPPWSEFPDPSARLDQACPERHSRATRPLGAHTQIKQLRQTKHTPIRSRVFTSVRLSPSSLLALYIQHPIAMVGGKATSEPPSNARLDSKNMPEYLSMPPSARPRPLLYANVIEISFSLPKSSSSGSPQGSASIMFGSVCVDVTAGRLVLLPPSRDP